MTDIFGSLAQGVIGLVVGVALGIQSLFFPLYDWFFLQTYQPTAQQQDFVTRAGMNSLGRVLFLQGKPSVEPEEKFQALCGVDDKEMIELGCYSGGRIYLLDLSGAELADESYVTAAHEMLHGAYQRLTPGARQEINRELEAAARKVMTPELSERLAGYERTEPGQRATELHSILGTEFPDLSAGLERYYQKYFTNRSAVVAIHRENRAVLDSLKSRIEAEKAQLTALRARMDRLLAAGDVRTYNSLVAEHNALLRRINREVDQYNALQTFQRLGKPGGGEVGT